MCQVGSLCFSGEKTQKEASGFPTIRPSLTLPVPEAVSLRLCSPASLAHHFCPPLGPVLPPLLGVSIGRSNLQVGGSSSEMPLGLLDRDKSHSYNDSIPLLGAARPQSDLEPHREHCGLAEQLPFPRGNAFHFSYDAQLWEEPLSRQLLALTP